MRKKQKAQSAINIVQLQNYNSPDIKVDKKRLGDIRSKQFIFQLFDRSIYRINYKQRRDQWDLSNDIRQRIGRNRRKQISGGIRKGDHNVSQGLCAKTCI